MKYLTFTSLIILFASCNSGIKKEHTIAKFDNIIIDTLVPQKNHSYTTLSFTIMGKAEDTVIVKFGKNGIPFYFKGEINSQKITDYYGERSAVIIFDPYKCKKGNLKYTCSIN